MKTKRILFIASLCLLFAVCYYMINQTYDELARYPYATEENHDIILSHLDEKDIDYLLAQNIRPEQFLPYVDCPGFDLSKTLWYDKAMQIQPADAAYIVNFINTWNEKFTFNDLDHLLNAYTYSNLATFYTNGDPFVKNAELLINPNDILASLDGFSIDTYVPSDLVALGDLPHVNIFSETDKEVYIRSEALEPLQEMCNAMSEASGTNNYNMIIVGGYVSYEEQKHLYQNALLQYGADTFKLYEDYPGHSERQLGYTLTFSIIGVSDPTEIKNSEQAKWFKEHAYEYGFIVRYPAGSESITKKAAQPLTLRYVGKKNAKKMQDDKIVFEEMRESK